MKKSTELTKLTGISMLFLAIIAFCANLFTSIKVIAQTPDKVDVNISANGGSAWYGQPWVWVVGLAVFIVVIVAITRSGDRNA
jgi:hypothetical protein